MRRTPHALLTVLLLALPACSGAGTPAADDDLAGDVAGSSRAGGQVATDGTDSTGRGGAGELSDAAGAGGRSDAAAAAAESDTPTASTADAAGASDTQPDVAAPGDAPRPGAEPDVATSPPPELHGQVPAVALPAPEFTVLNADGATRTRPDLVGKPTVMWFFPLSGTPG